MSYESSPIILLSYQPSKNVSLNRFFRRYATKQPKLVPLCRQIFCKGTSVSSEPSGSISRWPCFKHLDIKNLCRHEFFVKKFERALLQAVESNRLRRFGRLHEFF